MSAPNQLSFLPEDYLERKAKRRAVVVCGLMSALTLGRIGTMFVMREQATRDVQERFSRVDAQHKQAAVQIVQVERMRAKQKQIVHHAELAAALVEKAPRSNLLAEFTNALPPGASLLELVMESKPRPATAPPAGATAVDQKKAELENKARSGAAEARPMDVSIRLTGMADNDVQVAQFITRLNASRLLKDVNLIVTETYQHEKAPVRRFQIEMMLNPAAEVRPEPAAG